MAINCTNQPISYTIKTDTETFKLTSVDFQGLMLNTFDGARDGSIEVGCEAKIADALAILTYKPKADAKKLTPGELIAVEFVPKSFRMMSEKEIEETLAKLNAPTEVAVTSASPGTIIRTSVEPDPQQLRDAMAASIRAAIAKPGAGEKQVQGFIDHAECTNKGTFFFFKSQSQLIKLSVTSPKSLKVRGFTPDIERVQMGCTMKNVDVSAIVTYRDTPDTKAKTTGELIAIDFVPASFVLEN
jgi:hypothetical protein